MAWGMLNNWEFPKVPGLHDFKGPYMHTADYDTTFDPTDKVVALVGGGSTGVQVLPGIQTKARKVKHYMRSQYGAFLPSLVFLAVLIFLPGTGLRPWASERVSWRSVAH
jgi:cation diffusion facilitator CzcD-associated flavoprotein CzcO